MCGYSVYIRMVLHHISWWFNSICLMQGHHADTLIMQLRCRSYRVSAPARDCGGTSLHPIRQLWRITRHQQQAQPWHKRHLESHHAEGIPVAQRWAGTQLLNFCSMIFVLILTLLPTKSAAKLSVLGWVKLCEESLAIVEGRNVARCQLLHRGLSGKAVPAKLQTPTLWKLHAWTTQSCSILFLIDVFVIH